MSMKTTVHQLKVAIKNALVAVNAKTCQLHMSADQLQVKASTFAGYVRVSVEATGFTEREVIGCFNGAATNALFASLDPSTEVTISALADGLRLRFGGASIKLKNSESDGSIDSLFEAANGCSGHDLVADTTGSDLIKAFQSVQNYAAQNDVRSFLCGVHMSVRDGMLCLTATNGFMLNDVNTGIPSSIASISVIVPSAASKAIDMVVQPSEKVQLFLSGERDAQKVILKTGRLCWVSSLIVGQFPDCARLYEGEHLGEVSDWVVSAKELAIAVQRIAAISGKPFVKLRAKSETVTVLSEEGDHKVDVRSSDAIERGLLRYQPSEWEATFSPDYLHEIAQSVPTEFMLLRKGRSTDAKLYVRPVHVEGGPAADWMALLQSAKGEGERSGA
ncbi:MAG: hypothetical protein KGZ70_13685 [Hydrogenophaga sp.]|nr:hypothetical protein [Hydrogenophaga sp.]